MPDNPIPEMYRRKALYAALYHHDGVSSYAGGEMNGDPIRAELDPREDTDPTPYVKRVAGALGFAMSAEGQFMLKLTPDTEHALAGLRGEYNEEPETREGRA